MERAAAETGVAASGSVDLGLGDRDRLRPPTFQPLHPHWGAKLAAELVHCWPGAAAAAELVAIRFPPFLVCGPAASNDAIVGFCAVPR